MTGKEELLSVTQADRGAAASAYFAWLSGNPVIPSRMIAGEADDHSMVQAFAHHRHDSQAELVACLRVVLDGDPNGNFVFATAGNPNAADQFLERARALLARLEGPAS